MLGMRRRSGHCFKKIGPTPASFCLFSVFSNKQYIFYSKSMWKNVMSNQCRDSNPRPLNDESSPTTTRPGLPPYLSIVWVDNTSLVKSDPVRLVSSLTGLYTVVLGTYKNNIFFASQTQLNRRPAVYSDTSPYGKCSLPSLAFVICLFRDVIVDLSWS